jgi:hypothetical protein
MYRIVIAALMFSTSLLLGASHNVMAARVDVTRGVHKSPSHKIRTVEPTLKDMRQTRKPKRRETAPSPGQKRKEQRIESRPTHKPRTAERSMSSRKRATARKRKLPGLKKFGNVSLKRGVKSK